MTTKVTVEPAGHTVQITVYNHGTSETEIENGSIRTSTSTNQTITLEPGAAPWVGYVHDSQSINVREVSPNELASNTSGNTLGFV